MGGWIQVIGTNSITGIFMSSAKSLSNPNLLSSRRHTKSWSWALNFGDASHNYKNSPFLLWLLRANCRMDAV